MNFDLSINACLFVVIILALCHLFNKPCEKITGSTNNALQEAYDAVHRMRFQDVINNSEEISPIFYVLYEHGATEDKILYYMRYKDVCTALCGRTDQVQFLGVIPRGMLPEYALTDNKSFLDTYYIKGHLSHTWDCSFEEVYKNLNPSTLKSVKNRNKGRTRVLYTVHYNGLQDGVERLEFYRTFNETQSALKGGGKFIGVIATAKLPETSIDIGLCRDDKWALQKSWRKTTRKYIPQ